MNFSFLCVVVVVVMSRDWVVRMGTCGWSDASLLKCGRFYPASVRTTEDRLRHYSGFFSCVEVDTSTYAIPSPFIVKRWCEKVPDGFLFHFKAFGLFTSQSVPISTLPRAVKELDSVRTLLDGPRPRQRISQKELPADAVDAAWQNFNDSCREAMTEKKLGLIIFQFHLGFRPSEENYQTILDCRKRLCAEFGMAVEFRDRSWLEGDQLPRTLLALRDLGVVLVACDDLAHELYGTPAPVLTSAERLAVVLETTAPALGLYVRLHRREGCERVIGDDEVRAWADRLRGLRRSDPALFAAKIPLPAQLVHSHATADAGDPSCGICCSGEDMDCSLPAGSTHSPSPFLPAASSSGVGGSAKADSAALVGCEDRPGTVFFMWGTDHEDQPIINARNLAAALPELIFDWKAHLRELNERGGGLLAFFGRPKQKADGECHVTGMDAARNPSDDRGLMRSRMDGSIGRSKRLREGAGKGNDAAEGCECDQLEGEAKRIANEEEKLAPLSQIGGLSMTTGVCASERRMRESQSTVRGKVATKGAGGKAAKSPAKGESGRGIASFFHRPSKE